MSEVLSLCNFFSLVFCFVNSPCLMFLSSHSTSWAQEHSNIFKCCLWTVECWLSQENKEETPSVDIPSPKGYCPLLTYVLCLNSRDGFKLVKWPRKWRCLLPSLTLDRQVDRNNSCKVFFDHKVYMLLGTYKPYIHILTKKVIEYFIWLCSCVVSWRFGEGTSRRFPLLHFAWKWKLLSWL